MSFLTDFISGLPEPARSKFLSLNSPFEIQAYLDSLPYVAGGDGPLLDFDPAQKVVVQ